MPSFAVVAEGVTDQIVIERLIEAMCEDTPDDPVVVNYAQPLLDQTDAHHANHAGWGLVLDYCEHEVADALATNSYVVIHIDTDAGEDAGFGLPLTEGGIERGHAELIEGAKAILIDRMGAVATAAALPRIIFAIAVHATESWLLLILFRQARTQNTFDHLVRTLARKDVELAKEARRYRELTRGIKNKAIRPHVESDHSLGVFLRNLRDQTAA